MINYHIYRGFSFMGYPNIIQNHTNDINTIKSTYTPRSGTTMTGTLTFSIDNVIKQHDNVSTLTIFGGMTANEGGNISLYGKEHSSAPGYFIIRANNGTNNKNLEGRPDGKLYWGGNEIATRDIPTYVAAETLTAPAVSGKLCVVKASKDNAPNNGVILSTYTSASWWGQLYIGDNSTQGIYFRGMSDGVVGNWYRLVDENRCKAFVTETGKSGTIWYRKYSDGWIEQGGTVSISGWQIPTITLLKAFSNTNYTISVSGISYGGSYHAIGCLQSKTTTSFTHYFYNDKGINPSWYACGY